MYHRDTEIRYISSADVYKLGQILEQTQSWKKLMGGIPKDSPTRRGGTEKYNSDHIKLIENASIIQNRMCTEILIEEWGTSGKRRPTIGNLLDLLIKAELFRAADFVAINLLNEPVPKRPLKGPAARVDISIPLESGEIREVENILEDLSYPGTTNLVQNAQVPSSINNKDYYEKVRPGEKKVEVPQSNLIKFSTNIVSVGNATTFNFNEEAVSMYVQEVDSTEIPVLSALHNENVSNTLPDLSALNFMENEDDILKTEERSANNSSIPSASSISIEDSSITPNLSILDQSNINDSSLTNVTETSEENIFASNENLQSQNIPCLSVLNK